LGGRFAVAVRGERGARRREAGEIDGEAAAQDRRIFRHHFEAALLEHRHDHLIDDVVERGRLRRGAFAAGSDEEREPDHFSHGFLSAYSGGTRRAEGGFPWQTAPRRRAARALTLMT